MKSSIEKEKKNIDGINNCTKEYVGAFILGKKLLAIDPTKKAVYK